MFLLWICSAIVAIMSFIVTYCIIKDRKSLMYFLMPVFMDIIVILAIFTENIAIFGILGVFGVIPFVKKYAKK